MFLLREICAVAGVMGKRPGQRDDVIHIRRNESRKVETIFLKWMDAKGQNSEVHWHLDYTVRVFWIDGDINLLKESEEMEI